MVLRSASDWHLDPQDAYTTEVFLADRGLRPSDVEPLAIELYLEYAAWFQRQAGVRVEPAEVVRLDVASDGRFDAALVMAPYMRTTPLLLLGCVILRRFHKSSRPCFLRDGSNTAATSHVSKAKGERCLIIGGRQSAFEWAALLHEAGASSLDVVHRHASPKFEQSEWKWATELAAGRARDPTWYRSLSQPETRHSGRRGCRQIGGHDTAAPRKKVNVRPASARSGSG
jgi:FAD-dependent urate hydroxylase